MGRDVVAHVVRLARVTAAILRILRILRRGFANSQPYLHTIPSDLRSFNQLFRALGVRDSFSSSDYINALESIADDYSGNNFQQQEQRLRMGA